MVVFRAIYDNNGQSNEKPVYISIKPEQLEPLRASLREAWHSATGQTVDVILLHTDQPIQSHELYIAELVSKEFGITTDELTSSSRSDHLVQARAMFIYLLNECLYLSVKKIDELINRKRSANHYLPLKKDYLKNDQFAVRFYKLRHKIMTYLKTLEP